MSVLAWDEMNKGKLSIPGRILRNSKGNPQPLPGRYLLNWGGMEEEKE